MSELFYMLNVKKAICVWEGAVELYRWQKECLAAWEAQGGRGIVNVVTGAGKTVFAMAAIDRLRQACPDLRVRIVVPVIPLANQWKNDLMHAMPSEEWRPGFFGGGQRDDPDRRVLIYIINTARTTLAAHMRREFAQNHPVLLICDECHHTQSKENRKIYSFLTSEIEAGKLYYSLGLSATPFGTANDEVLLRSLGREIYRYDVEAAVKEGVLSPFTVCEVSASFLADESQKYAELSFEIGIALRKLLLVCPSLKGLPEVQFMKRVSKMAKEADMDPEDPAAAFLILTYQRKEISNLARARIRCAMGILERISRRDRVLIFCERIAQAEDLMAQLRRREGHSVGLYHSEMTAEARKRVLDQYRSGELRILVSCRCLDEGIDVPEANVGIVMSSSAVSRQRRQRLGRVIRRAPGKAAACLYYIYIRESTDDAAYLQGLDASTTYGLRYYSAEDTFANDLYEYVAGDLLRRAADRGMSPEVLAELRRCLLEGLIRPDYLVEESVQRQAGNKAATIHEKNYWRTMRRVGSAFRAAVVPDPGKKV